MEGDNSTESSLFLRHGEERKSLRHDSNKENNLKKVRLETKETESISKQPLLLRNAARQQVSSKAVSYGRWSDKIHRTRPSRSTPEDKIDPPIDTE